MSFEREEKDDIYKQNDFEATNIWKSETSSEEVAKSATVLDLKKIAYGRFSPRDSSKQTEENYYLCKHT